MLFLQPAALQAPAPDPDFAVARAIVEACYRDHLKRRVGFDLKAVKAKRRWFTPGLMEVLLKELRRPSNPDEVPTVDGDPFTNSQEPVTSKKVGEAKRAGGGLEVALHLEGEGFKRDFQVLLKQEKAGWRIDDIRYDDGTTLRGFLAAAR